MQFLINLIILLVISYLLGTNLAHRGKCIGFRSIALLLLGCYSFTTISLFFGAGMDRVVSNIVTGVGFIGAGIIWKREEDDSVHNLTTAISVWAISAVGVLIGLNMIKEAVIIALIILIILSRKNEKA